MIKAKDNKPDDNTFVSSYLLYLLAASSEAASAQFHEHVRDNGLRVVEWRILACLYDQDGLMVTHLAKFALIEQSRLTKIIDQMVERDLLQKKTDPNDRRRVRIYLMPEGLELSKQMVNDARVHEDKLLGMLSETSAVKIKPFLQSLLKKLGEI